MMDFFILLLIVGNLFAVFVGAMLLVAPDRLASWSRFGDSWISTRKLLKPLEVPHETEGTMLRYPRVLGVLLLLSGLFILIKGGLFISGLSAADGGRLLARFFATTDLPSGAWETLWLSLLGLILLGALLAVAVGVLALFKLEALHQWARLSNRWISTRQALKPLDQPHEGFDHLIRARPRLWGALIMLFALYSCVVLIWLSRTG